MSKLQAGQRIRVFEVVSSSYSHNCFKIGSHYAEHIDSELANNKYGCQLVNDSKFHDKLGLYIGEVGDLDAAKQVGTLIIKKIK